MSKSDETQTGKFDNERNRGRMEVIIATLLGLAAVLTAVAGYQSALRGGDSIQSFNDGIRSTNDANAFYSEATQTVSRDQALFLEYAKAAQDPKTAELSQYLKATLMDENLSKATDEWQDDETDKIATPLDAPSYAVPQQDEAERLSKLTDRQFNEARALDDEGDQYDLVGVIVASSLFFLGIAGVMSSFRIKLVGTALGTGTLVAATAIWLSI